MPPSDIDVVIPIPESSRPSAMQLAHRIGKPYREGFVKNRYVGRTFIMPGQGVRKKSVRQKLNAIGMEFKGRNVLLVDDSIVRGTTSKEIVQMAREAGARKVYMASAAPPVRFPNVYGIDMPTKEELIAHDRSIEEIRAFIGADALIYQDVDAMKRVVGALNPKLDGFEASCFDGIYITGDVSAEDFASMERQRRLQFDEDEEQPALAPGAAGRGDHAMTIPRVDLPPGVRPGHAGRARGPAAHALGRKLRGAVPHQFLRAPRRRHRGAALRQRGRGLRLQPLRQPDGDDDGAPAGGHGRHQRLHRHRQRHGGHPDAGSWRLLKGGDHVVCSQSVFGSTIRLLQDFAKFGIETSFVSQTDVAQWRARDAAEHQAAVRRVAHQPADRGLRHRRAGRGRPRAAARCWRWTTASAARRCSSR